MPDFMSIGRAILAKQPFSQFLGTELVELASGRAVLALDVKPEFLQQNGFVHGGVLSYLIDNAITFAGGSVLGEKVVTAEYKVNYISPARGERLEAVAVAESSGGRFSVCSCELFSVAAGKKTRCALGQGTIALLK